MKRKILRAITFVTVIFATATLFGQTNSPATNPPPAAASDTFLSDVQNYFTSFSTNVWSGTKGYVETGALYEHKINVGNFLEAGVDFDDLSTNFSLYGAAQSINAVALGDTTEATLRLGVAYRTHDVQLMLSAGAGYAWATKAPEGVIGVQLQKKMTSKTFAGLGADQAILGKSSNTRVFLLAGFSF